MSLFSFLFPQMDELNGNLKTVIRQNRTLINLSRDNRFLMERTMTTAKELIAKLVKESSDLKSVKDSVVLAVSTFTANAQNALDAGDMAALQSLVTEFDSSTKEIANAVANNTPVSSEPESTTPVQPVVTDTPVVTPEPTPEPTADTPNP